jgi:ATP-dependent HslUV protease subunit HslV
LTTIVSVRRHGKVVMGGDGQVSLGNTVMKGNAKKFAACTTGRSSPVLPVPPLTPLPSSSVSKASWKKHQGHLVRAAATKEWRTDRSLSRLEAMLAVANKDASDHHRQRRRG